MIERSNCNGAVERLAGCEDAPVLALGGNVSGKNLAVVAKGFHRGPTKDFYGPANLVTGLPHGEAAFTRDKARDLFTLRIKRASGQVDDVPVRCRIDTPIEIDYYQHGGILPFVLRQLIGKP